MRRNVVKRENLYGGCGGWFWNFQNDDSAVTVQMIYLEGGAEIGNFYDKGQLSICEYTMTNDESTGVEEITTSNDDLVDDRYEKCLGELEQAYMKACRDLERVYSNAAHNLTAPARTGNRCNTTVQPPNCSAVTGKTSTIVLEKKVIFKFPLLEKCSINNMRLAYAKCVEATQELASKSKCLFFTPQK